MEDGNKSEERNGLQKDARVSHSTLLRSADTEILSSSFVLLTHTTTF